MNMRSSANELYRFVVNARESCAGDSVKSKLDVIMMIDIAIDFASRFDAPMLLINKLINAKTIMEDARNYSDRLPADRLLSSVLNNELNGFG